MKIILFGGSGSGTTTLATSLAKQLNWVHLDVDDFYWMKTTIPFQTKLPKEVRKKQLKAAFEAQEHVIVSGSLISWGDYWKSAFDLGVFLRLAPAIRMERLRMREIERYGKQLEKNSEIKKKSETFLAWAKQYDDPSFEGRSISYHKKWIASLACPCLEIEEDLTNLERVKLVLRAISCEKN